MIDFIGLWSHALAALLYGALAVWQLRHWNGDMLNRPLVTAFAVMSVWAIFQATAGPADLKSNLAESARNLAFLTFMYGIGHAAADDRRQRAVKVVYGAVASVIGLQIILALLMPQLGGHAEVAAALASTRHSIDFTIAAGSLVLVHNLYAQVARNSRWGIRLPVIALAAMWAYDLHLYTVAYLTQAPFDDLFALRGVTAAALVPLFAMATRRNADWRVQLSRTATFQSLSLLAIIGYFIAMLSATRLFDAVEGEWVRLVQVGIIIGMTILAAILFPSRKLRAWLRVLMAKHFFEHRYDYREDWLRFTRAVGRSEDARPIEERVVKALADIAGSSGGLLLTLDESRRLGPAGGWNWAHGHEPSGPATPDLIRFLETTAFVIDFGGVRDGTIGGKRGAVALPAWLAGESVAWAGVPLVHNDRLLGIVLLDHPAPSRPMDWEDYDLFRTAGIQAASYLAEAQSQEALGHAQRFDEFNRRFAFIMHDIKNLVSQLSLVARNAERHADNPEFREDMIATLQSSVRKMNDLLVRLSGGSGGEAQAPRPIALHAVLGAVVEGKRRSHPVTLSGDPSLHALADPARLEQAVSHLVQNAIDASPEGAAVAVSCRPCGHEVAIEIADRGAGMPAEFLRARLFQPFVSTKDTGFGVGAFEARALIVAMGGRIAVESREGEGSRFTIHLPSGEADAPPILQRIRA